MPENWTPRIEWLSSKFDDYVQYTMHLEGFWREPMEKAIISLFSHCTRNEFTDLINGGVDLDGSPFYVRHNRRTGKTSIWVAHNDHPRPIPVQWYCDIETSSSWAMEFLQDYFIKEYNKVVAEGDRVKLDGLNIVRLGE